MLANYEYKGLNISVSEGLTVDIKKPCGELVWGWEFVSSIGDGVMKAFSFIDNMSTRGWVMP
jgi:hypothetical protein